MEEQLARANIESLSIAGRLKCPIREKLNLVSKNSREMINQFIEQLLHLLEHRHDSQSSMLRCKDAEMQGL